MLTRGHGPYQDPGLPCSQPLHSYSLTLTLQPPGSLSDPHPPAPARPLLPGLPRSALGISAHAYLPDPTPAFLAISCSFLDPSPNVPFSSKSPLFRSTWDPVDFPQP